VAAQAYGAVILGDGRVRLAWGGADGPGEGEAAGLAAHPAQALRPAMQWAAGESAAISETAEREAAVIIRQASVQSAAIREAAELEAAELRAAIAELSARVGGVVYVTEDLFTPATPGGQVTTRPAAKPLARPVSGSRGRQVRAMRKVAIAFVALFLVGAITGAVEIDVHGFSFFLFRNAGAGAGNAHDLNENQGPGQPGAPAAHHAVNRG
jgi:hypothetical protein